MDDAADAPQLTPLKYVFTKTVVEPLVYASVRCDCHRWGRPLFEPWNPTVNCVWGSQRPSLTKPLLLDLYEVAALAALHGTALYCVHWAKPEEAMVPAGTGQDEVYPDWAKRERKGEVRGRRMRTGIASLSHRRGGDAVRCSRGRAIRRCTAAVRRVRARCHQIKVVRGGHGRGQSCTAA